MPPSKIHPPRKKSSRKRLTGPVGLRISLFIDGGNVAGGGDAVPETSRQGGFCG